MEVQYLEIPSYVGLTVRQMLTSPTNSADTLMVILPGRGYTVDAPLLHYCRKLGWKLGYDVLTIQYGFHAAQTDFNTADMLHINQESLQAIHAAQALKGYKKLILVGKSLGTPLAAFFAGQLEQVLKVILLTPIQQAQKMIQGIPTLAVIGTADAAYDASATVDTDFLNWKVYPDLNHSLEVPDDVQGSILVLARIMQDCEDFLKQVR